MPGLQAVRAARDGLSSAGSDEDAEVNVWDVKLFLPSSLTAEQRLEYCVAGSKRKSSASGWRRLMMRSKNSGDAFERCLS